MLHSSIAKVVTMTLFIARGSSVRVAPGTMRYPVMAEATRPAMPPRAARMDAGPASPEALATKPWSRRSRRGRNRCHVRSAILRSTHAMARVNIPPCISTVTAWMARSSTSANLAPLLPRHLRQRPGGVPGRNDREDRDALDAHEDLGDPGGHVGLDRDGDDADREHGRVGVEGVPRRDQELLELAL